MRLAANPQVTPDYNPDRVLDVLSINFRVKNDSALARMLEVSPPIISKIRRRKTAVGASLLIRIHEVCGLEIDDLRCLMGDRRQKFRIGDFHERRKNDATLHQSKPFCRFRSHTVAEGRR